jgi:hypothetical protein
MATDKAVAAFLAVMAELYPTRPITAATLSAYALALAPLADEDLGRATGTLAREPGRKFFPTPGEVLAAAQPQLAPVDVDRLCWLLSGLTTYTPHGVRPPSLAAVADHFGPEVADVCASVGLDRLLTSDAASAEWARKALREALASAPHLPPEVPRVGQAPQHLPQLLEARTARGEPRLSAPPLAPEIRQLTRGIGDGLAG